MMKKLISLFLVLCLLASCCTAFAADEKTTQKADGLNLLGLFEGTNNGYELDKNLTREQGVAMLLRVIGLDAAAKATTEKCVFTDVYDWAKPYVAYAYAKKITNGASETLFGYGKALTDAMFLTMILRALGHEDGEGKEFVWNAPYELAAKEGLISKAEADKSFTRGDMVNVIWNTLNAKYKDGTKVSDKLTADKVITAEYLTEAKKVSEGTETLADAKKTLGIVEATDVEAEIPSVSISVGGGASSSATIGGSFSPSKGIGGSTTDNVDKDPVPLTDADHTTPYIPVP